MSLSMQKEGQALIFLLSSGQSQKIFMMEFFNVPD